MKLWIEFKYFIKKYFNAINDFNYQYDIAFAVYDSSVGHMLVYDKIIHIIHIHTRLCYSHVVPVTVTET